MSFATLARSTACPPTCVEGRDLPTRRHRWTGWAATALAAALAGCGGGGDDGAGQSSSAQSSDTGGGRRAHAQAITPQQAALARWTDPIALSLVPVSGTVLDANRVLFWSAGYPNNYDGWGGHGATTIYDFSTGTAVDHTLTAAESGQDLFCPGTARLADGKLLVSGGNGDPTQTTLYDPATNTWSVGPKLNSGRGYNADTLLGDGSVLTVGGSWSGGSGAKASELYTAANGWRTLSGISTADPTIVTQDSAGFFRSDNHMWLVPTGNGRVLHAGPSRNMHWFDVSGNGSVASAGTRGSDSDSMNGDAVMYDAGKILTLGGGINYDSAVGKNAAFIIDTTGGAANVHSVLPMAYGRVFANSVVLPNGQVVVLGGQTLGVGFSDDNSVLAAELFDPATESFTTLPAMSVGRNYHSIGLLLADGRVISAGSGLCACAGDHLNMQVLSPPYLFNADGTAALRPVLSSVPATVAYGSTVTVSTDGPVTAFSMVRLGAATHTVNNDQRRVALAFTAGTTANSYQLSIPTNPGILLPGQWMLFAMNAQGTPSVAKFVTVGLNGVATLKNPGDQSGSVGAVASVSVTASGASSFSATGLPSGTTVNASTGQITGAPTAAGTYVVSLSAKSSTATVSTDFVWAVAAAIPPVGTGLLGQYYGNTTVSGTPVVSTIGAPAFDVVAGPLPPAGVPTVFSARYSGWLEPTVSGTTVFQTLSDDGVRVWIDGKLVIDDWNGHVATANAASVNLLVGRRVPVLIEYFQGGGTGSLQVNWQPPGASALAPVPVARLYPAAVLTNSNLALKQPTLSSSMAYWGGPERAVDGNTDGTWANNSVISTNDNQQGWWQVDLQQTARIDLVQLWNRTDSCCVFRLQNVTLFFSASDMSKRTVADLQADATVLSRTIATSNIAPNIGIPVAALGRYVRVQGLTANALNIAEVQVWGSTTYSVPTVAVTAPGPSAVGNPVSLTPTGSDPAGGRLMWGATGLPSGLSIDPGTGVMSGSPTAAGTSTVTLSAVNASGLQASTSFTWQINLDAVAGLTAPVAAAGKSVSYAPTAPAGSVATYSWSFGDGSTAPASASSPAVSHTYAAPGVYTVVLTAKFSDGTSAVYTLLQAVTATGAASAVQPSTSNDILLEPRAGASARLWVVNPDSNSVSVFDTAGYAKLAEVPVGTAPRALALGSDGRVWVSNKRDASISIISPSSLAVVQTVALQRGSQPFGLVVSPLDGSVFVALEGTGQLLKLDRSSGATTASLAVGPNPRHLAMTADGKKLLVSRYISRPLPGEGTASVNTVDASGAPQGGEVLLVDPAAMTLGATMVLRHSDKTDLENAGRGLPNYLGAAAISPDGTSAWIPSNLDNVKRGTLRDGNALNFQNTVRAVSSRLDLTTSTEDYAGRIDHDNAGVPSAARYHPSGAYVFVALETNRQVAVLDPVGKRELFRIEVGLAPQGLTISADGTTLYVSNFMSRSVSVVDLTPFVVNGSAATRTLATLAATSIDPLAPDVLKGKQFFYDARDTRLARDSYMSCASCHNDGGHDGRTWDMTSLGEGLRNTIALNGRAGMGHGTLHWSANFDEVQDFEGQIRTLSGGTGLMSDALFNTNSRSQPLGLSKAGLSADLDALAAYLGSLASFAPSPYRNSDGSMTAAAQAGAAVFTDNCSSCHAGINFTASATPGAARNIGTIKASSGKRLNAGLGAIDVPTLRDVWSSAPYLHDGSASTLAAAVGAHNNVALSAADLANVVAYVQQIGGDEPYAATNLALGRVASQSSTVTGGDAARAIDGNTDGVFADNSVAGTGADAQPWWQVDLGLQGAIQSIRLWNRTDCCAASLANVTVFISAADMSGRTLAQLTADATVTKTQVATLNGAASVTLPFAVQGRYVKVQLAGTGNLNLAEVQVVGLPTNNLALGKKSTQSSTAFSGDASRAVDGNIDGVYNDNSVSHTDAETQPWWQVDLGLSYAVQSVRIFNRTDCCADRLSNAMVLTSATDMTGRTLAQLLADTTVKRIPVWSLGGASSVNLTVGGTAARYVRVQLVGSGYLSLAEVQVYGARFNIAQGKLAAQSSIIAGGDPSRAVDGNVDGVFGDNSVTHTDSAAQSWWQVDLGQVAPVDVVQLWNRTDCCATRLSNFSVFVSSTDMTGKTYAQLQADTSVQQVQVATLNGAPSIDVAIGGTRGRFVRVQLSGTDYLSLAEVRVFSP